ncbi:MAG: type VI secretion system tip protein VgrG [Planctomycetes bacterium]|nr:type VI secretion system tip protein VgrG [Planctomycetota bacterium]MBL7142754.1 type VI secretion system tip protein VgrG [Phycisphaerae bacterium]
MAKTQKNSEVAIGTPLGEDVLLLVSMSGTEQFSRPFEFQLELASEDDQIKSSDIIGQNVTIRLNLSQDKVRFFNGYISHFTQILGSLELARYRATVVPWLWFLTRTADCRIFQKKKVLDIIKQVFNDHGFTDIENALTGSYREWEYCVQYRETDFNFVNRLMEQEGIYYFFKHENGKHKLVLADSAGKHESYPDHDQIKFRPADLRVIDEECISDWIVETRIQPGLYTLNDFDYKNTQKDLQARAKVTREHAAADFGIYDYPGEYTETGDGEGYAKKRIEELQAQYEVVTASSDVRGICTGCSFTLTDHPREDRNKKYLITSANYTINSDLFQASNRTAYSCNFKAIDATQQFRSPRITPKPSIPGPQTAMVVGPSGEEIYTDEFSRVKVQFHWDRYSKADENSSCWIRVSQAWAGKKWGAIYIPRIGQEVIVEFLEGDPDQPIITGRVYNGQTMPPYELPAEKTKSTLKSNSSIGGGGFNEIRFEDKKDKEQIFIHGQRDEDVRILNDSKEWIGNERHLIVKKDQFEQVDGDKHLTVKGDQNEKINGTVSIEADMDYQHKVGMKHALEAGMDVHIKGGMKVIIEAGLQLSLKAAGSFVDIGPAGVSISGPMVMINSGGSAGSGAGCKPDPAKPPEEADTADPGEVSEPPPAPEPPTPVKFSPQATTLKQAAQDGTPFCEECEKARQQQAAQTSQTTESTQQDPNATTQTTQQDTNTGTTQQDTNTGTTQQDTNTGTTQQEPS